MVGCACWLSRRHHVQAAPRAPGARSPEHCAQGRGSRRFSRRVQRAKSSCSTLAHTHCGSTPGSAHGLRPRWGQLVVPFPGFSPTFSDPGTRHVSVRQGPASTVTVLVVVRGSRNRHRFLSILVSSSVFSPTLHQPSSSNPNFLSRRHQLQPRKCRRQP